MDTIERNISAIDVQLDKLAYLYLDSHFLRDKIDTRQIKLTEQRAKYTGNLSYNILANRHLNANY